MQAHAFQGWVVDTDRWLPRLSNKISADSSGWTPNILFLNCDAVLKGSMKALPAACPRCNRIFGSTNYGEGPALNGKDVSLLICQCGYVGRHTNTNVCRWSYIELLELVKDHIDLYFWSCLTSVPWFKGRYTWIFTCMVHLLTILYFSFTIVLPAFP